MRTIRRPRRPGALRALMRALRAPGAPPHPSIDGIVVAPPAPSHRPPGTPAFGPSAWSPSDHYSPLALLKVRCTRRRVMRNLPECQQHADHERSHQEHGRPPAELQSKPAGNSEGVDNWNPKHVKTRVNV